MHKRMPATCNVSEAKSDEQQRNTDGQSWNWNAKGKQFGNGGKGPYRGSKNSRSNKEDMNKEKVTKREDK